MGPIGEDKDRKLEYAYQLYMQGLCGCGCGHPAHLAHHPSNDGWYTAHTTVCHAKAAQDRFSEGRQPEPGELVYTTYDRPKDKPLPPLNGGQNAATDGEHDAAENQDG